MLVVGRQADQIAHRSIPGWFPEENEQELSRLILEHGIRSVIDVGAFVGKSTVFFAQRVARVFSVDTFQGTDEHYLSTVPQLVANMRREFDRNTAAYHNVQVFAADSLEAAKFSPIVDLVYIDASHKYNDVVLDIEAWAPLAGKVLCGDDYHWPEVRAAVDRHVPGVQSTGRFWWVET